MPLSPLPGIDAFQSGVGDNRALQVFIREDLEGGWFAALAPGFFYVGADEGYLFARRRQQEVTVAASGVIQTVTVTGLDYDPTERGPLRLRRAANDRALERVCSPLRVFQTLSFSGTGDIRSATASGLLVSLVSDPVTGVYLQVPHRDDIVTAEDYVYAPRTGLIELKDTDPPALFGTWVVPAVSGDQLLQEEIVEVDRDGYVRTQYSPVWAASGALAPTIRKPTPSGAIDVTGTVLSGNVIQLPASGIVSGDLIGVSYYVQDSFTAVYDAATGTLTVRLLAAASGTHILEWESHDGLYDTAWLPTGHVNRLQLNPLLERLEPCFYYLCDSDLPLPAAARLEIRLAEQNPVWDAYVTPPLFVQVRAVDAEGWGTPQDEITLTATLNGQPLDEQSAETDSFGKAYFSLTPNASGTLLITAVCSDGPSGTVSGTVHAKATTDAAGELALGKLLLHLEETPFRDGLFRLNAHYVYLDGAPYQPDGSDPTEQPWRGVVTFSSGRSRLVALDGRALGPSGSVDLDQDGIATVLVAPEPGDVLRAEIVPPGTSRRRVAAPVRVFAAPSAVDTPSSSA